MEGDGIPMMRFGVASLFQSTPSAWRVTLTGPGSQLPAGISIHTLRMEGDSCGRSPLLPGPYFNPHPPHGGWQQIRIINHIVSIQFLLNCNLYEIFKFNYSFKIYPALNRNIPIYGANLSSLFCSLFVRTQLYHKNSLRFIGWFRTYMFYFCLIMIS